MDSKAFQTAREAEGYAGFVERDWPAGTVNDDHAHEFAAAAIVLDGEITIRTDNGVTTCRVGDTFQLDAGIPHKEVVGPTGVRFLVGRKSD